MKEREQDYFQEIISNYFNNKELLFDKQFRMRLRENLFSETDSVESEKFFFTTLDRFAELPVQKVPLLSCLIIEEDVKYGTYKSFRDLDGQLITHDWSADEFREANKYLRILTYYCGKKDKIIDYVSSIDIEFYSSHNRDDLFGIKKNSDKINAAFSELQAKHNLSINMSEKPAVFKPSVENRYCYIIDCLPVPDSICINPISISKKLVQLKVALIIPIFYEFDTNDNFKKEELDHLLTGRFIYNTKLGVGEIKRYHTCKSIIDVYFLHHPGDTKVFLFPESFESNENSFTDKVAFQREKDSLAKYYKSKLVGKKVTYMDTEYNENGQVIEVECIGTIVDYIVDRILVTRLSPINENHRFNTTRCFVYPIIGINLYGLKVLDE